jgi:hypothetical protein
VDRPILRNPRLEPLPPRRHPLSSRLRAPVSAR